MTTNTQKTQKRELLSVVVPAYNEEEVLEEFHTRIAAVFDNITDMDCEVIYVNDGSKDRTQSIIDTLCEQDSRVSAVNLSRNFGKEPAMTAGFDHAKGDAVVIIDADLQDQPELIPDMITIWREGYDVVYAQRAEREGESWFKKITASAFYRLIQRMSKVQIPKDTGDFRLMSRRVIEDLLSMRETHRFMKGLFAYVGYPSKALVYNRDARAAGETKFNYWKLWNFALEGITSFTIAPLQLATYMGLTVAGGAFVYMLWIIFNTLFGTGSDVDGYPSLMVVILFMGGVQLTFIGILGEYLGRAFDEVKERPLYFVQKYHKAETAEKHAKEDVELK